MLFLGAILTFICFKTRCELLQHFLYYYMYPLNVLIVFMSLSRLSFKCNQKVVFQPIDYFHFFFILVNFYFGEFINIKDKKKQINKNG